MSDEPRNVSLDDALVKPDHVAEPDKDEAEAADLQAFDDLDDVEFLLEEIENRIAPLA
jgi:hypothetical protein